MATKEELLAQLRELKTQGLSFGDIVPVYAEDNTSRQRRLIDTARKQFAREGVLEFDDQVVASGSDDAGDYVMAWVWVDDDEEGEYDLADGVTLDRHPLPAEVPEGHVALVLQIDNTYADYEDVRTFASAIVPAPPEDKTSDEYDTWLFEHVIALTGVGHADGDSWYDLEVLESSDPDLIPVGTTYEWGY